MYTYTYNHWITDTEQPTTAKAFTYTIWFPELGLRYIGYKTVSNKSKWLTYKSSSRPVKELIRAGHKAIYRIVKWFDDAKDARAEEVSAMTSYDVTNRSEYLNQCISGVKFSNAGNTHTDDAKAKISAASKSRTHTDETRAKIGAAARNRSPETQAKITAAHKGRTRSDETRAKISASKQGRLRSDETRAKMSEAHQIGLYVTPLGTFKTAKEAAITHNCNPVTISYRCKSTSPQFDNWAFFKY